MIEKFLLVLTISIGLFVLILRTSINYENIVFLSNKVLDHSTICCGYMNYYNNSFFFLSFILFVGVKTIVLKKKQVGVV